MRMQVGNNLYEVKEKTADNLVNIAIEKFENEDKMAIIAVKQGKTIIMLRYTYETVTQFKAAKQLFREKGFKVFATK